MPDFIHLTGTEEVSRAAHQMTAAAAEMTRAAGWINETLSRSLDRAEELVERMEAIQKKRVGE